MITIRKASDRGHADHGWLDTYHTFSFADYHDPRFMGFRALRVINDDRVAPGRGFGAHGHRDMEIVTVVLSGALGHRDSMGNGSTITPGEVQRMSAGTGVVHSEVNPREDEWLHLLQIWILPERPNITPSYEQKKFEEPERLNQLRIVASPDARDGSVRIHQDVSLYVSTLRDGSVSHTFAPNRYGWIHVATGEVTLNGLALSAGDGAAISEEKDVTIAGNGEVLLFDLK
jgi:quercetin 2,3-dioxygenase